MQALRTKGHKEKPKNLPSCSFVSFVVKVFLCLRKNFIANILISNL